MILVLVFVLFVISTNVFQFVDPEFLPYLQVAEGIRFTAQDIGLFLLLVIGALAWRRRGERPLFLPPILFLGWAVVLSGMFGILAGSTDLDSFANGARLYSGYLLYLGLAGVIDTPRRLQEVVSLVFVIVVISVGIQIAEAIQGERIVLPFAGANEYFNTTVYVTAGGIRAPYLWNRAVEYLLVGFFLALGAGLAGNSREWHIPLAVFALLGFVVALTRTWFVLGFCGIATLVLIVRGERNKTLPALLGFGILFLVALNFVNARVESYALVDTLAYRLDSLLEFQDQANFVYRVNLQSQLFSQFLDSPIFGYGPGSGLINNDLGVVNTLIQIGIVGVAGIALLIVSVLFQAYRSLRRSPPSLLKAYLAGLFAAWVGMIVGYSFNVDFFGFMSMSAGLAMALIDRAIRFSEGKIASPTNAQPVQ